MKKKVVITLSALAVVGAAITGCVCYISSKVYGCCRFYG